MRRSNHPMALIAHFSVLKGHASVLKGHDFSRATNAAQQTRALAPEGCLSGISQARQRFAIRNSIGRLKFVLLPAFVLLSSTPCRSQESPQFAACEKKDDSQTGLDHCASDEAGRVDAALNRAYQQLRLKAKRTPGAIEKIEQLEKAWMHYRDAYLAAMYPEENKQAAYGSIFPMEFDLLRADLTREQTKKVKELIQQYEEEGQ